MTIDRCLLLRILTTLNVLWHSIFVVLVLSALIFAYSFEAFIVIYVCMYLKDYMIIVASMSINLFNKFVNVVNRWPYTLYTALLMMLTHSRYEPSKQKISCSLGWGKSNLIETGPGMTCMLVILAPAISKPKVEICCLALIF